MDNLDVKEFLAGRNRRVSKTAPVVGVLFGTTILSAYIYYPINYLFVPYSVTDWILLSILVLSPAVVAGLGGSLLACWSFDFPALLAISYYVYFVGYGTFVVLPDPEIVVLLGISGVFAVLWGTVGFVVGNTASRILE